jgi:hypothetical protein
MTNDEVRLIVENSPHMSRDQAERIIFDDLDWTYASSPTLKDREDVRRMPEDERTTPHVERIYELLVKAHPDFDEFRREPRGWAYARRTLTSGAATLVRREVVVEEVVRVEKVVHVEKMHVGLGSVLIRSARMLLGRQRRRPRG